MNGIGADGSGPRTVVVSGASSGIGRATVGHLALRGWRVFAGVRRPEDVPGTPADASGTVEPLHLDVTSDESVDRARHHLIAALGGTPLTGLVANAGIGSLAPMATVSQADLRAVFEVNVFGTVRLTQALLPAMGPRSRLVVLGSVGDRLTMPFGGPLTSSKWAVASIAEAWRLELAYRGIRVTLVEPGSIHTAAVDKVEAAADATADAIARTDPVLADRFRRGVRVAVRQERGGSEPAVVARAVGRTLDAARPRSRVLVGRHARLLAMLATVLPDPLFDAARLSLFDQRRP